MQRQFPNVTTILKYAISAAAGATATLIVMLAIEQLDIPKPLTASMNGIAELAPPDATQITIWDLDQLREGNCLDVYPSYPSTESFIEDKMVYLRQTLVLNQIRIGRDKGDGVCVWRLGQ